MSRIDLQALLVSVLGSNNVYFQPPPSMRIVYPCIVYKREPDTVKYANDHVYQRKHRYSITLIDKNPDNIIVERIAELPLCTFDRCFISDNLNHYSFTIYY